MEIVKKLARSKSAWFFLLPLLVFILLRLPLLHLPPFGDEAQDALEAVSLGMHNPNNPAVYPIMMFLILKCGSFFVGWSRLRWIPFLFSLGVWGLTVLIADDFIGSAGALCAAWLLALSPLSVMVSPQLIMNGAFVPFFFLAFVFAYERFLRSDVFRWGPLLCCGILFGCLWLTTYAVFALTAGIGLYSLVSSGFKKTLRDFAVIGIVAAAVFLPYPLLFPAHFHGSTQEVASTSSGLFHISHSVPEISRFLSMPWLYVSSWAKAVIFVGPLLFWGLARSFARKESRARLGLLLSACLSYMLLLLLLINPERTLDYWSPILPLLCVLAAGEIMAWIKSPRWRNILLWTAIYWAVLGFLTIAGPHAVFPAHPIHYARSFWMEFLSVRMFDGPSLSLFVRPAAILAPFAGLAIFWLLGKRFPAARSHLVALGLAYGLFFSLEYSRPLFSPNLNRAGAQMLESFKAEPPKQPFYLHGYSDIACERAGIHRVASFMYADNLISRLIPVMKRTGGTLALADAPDIGPDSSLRKFLSRNARLEKTFGNHGVALVEIWSLKNPPAAKPR